MPSPSDVRLFEVRIGYIFEDKAHLEAALTHATYASEQKLPYSMGPLAFLGDAMIELAVRRQLYDRGAHAAMASSPKWTGNMSAEADRIVHNPRFVRAATSLDIGSWIRFGEGGKKDNLKENKTVLASAFEAVIGAVYLDGGERIATRVALELLDVHAPQAMQASPTAMP